MGVLECAVTGAHVPLTIRHVGNATYSCEGKGEVDFAVCPAISHRWLSSLFSRS